MNIIENLFSKELPYDYDFGKDEITNYDIVNSIKSLSIIQQFYNDIEYSIKCVDDYINYLFLENLDKIKMMDDIDLKQEYVSEIKKIQFWVTEIKNKYHIQDVYKYIGKSYIEIFQYYSNEKHSGERNFVNMHIRLELRDSTIKKINYISDSIKDKIIEYLIKNDTILFFDNINLFKNYKRTFLEKLCDKQIIKRLSYYRLIDLLEFLSNNQKTFKKIKDYEKIIDILIDSVKDEKKHIYMQEKQCRNLIYFLKELKNIKVRKVEKLHEQLKVKVKEEIKKNGYSIGESISIKDEIQAYKNILKNKDTNDFKKLIFPHVLKRNDRLYMWIESIDEVEGGVTSEILGEDPYYCSIRIMQVEQFIVPAFNKFLFNYTIKSMGYRKLEKLIVRLVTQVFSTLFIEYSDNEIKKDIKGVMYSIKNCYKKYHTNEEKNYMYYINSTYIISSIKKIPLSKKYSTVSLNQNLGYQV